MKRVTLSLLLLLAPAAILASDTTEKSAVPAAATGDRMAEWQSGFSGKKTSPAAQAKPRRKLQEGARAPESKRRLSKVSLSNLDFKKRRR